jgi:D-alanyl-D-alanine carboxypeptidase/D-alanyl-D-alanine-endopeptidase (penicillin-binding protein 4)
MKRILSVMMLVLMAMTVNAQAVEVDSAAALPWPRNLQSKIDMVVQDPLLDVSQMGLLVWDLTADSAIYRYNDRQLMRPASTMKLVTAITALDKLGVNYKFNTLLYYTGEISDRTLHGDLYFVGGMDPMLETADLRGFARALRQLGIDTIRGSLLADKSMKDTLKWGEGWCWDDKNPTLSPLTLGRDTHFLERFAEVLYEDSLNIDSLTLGESTLPAGAFVVGTCQHTLDQVLVKMMKDSDNFYAECVLFQTAAASGRRPAKADDGLAASRRLINSIGLNASDYRLADGSGLSLYNYVTAELMTRLLRYTWRHKALYQHLQPTLPIAGQDGTLKKRMTRSASEGNVRAKTGTLTGIVSLAGYCTAANGHELCFAIINQGVMSWRKGRALQDRICDTLCEP